MINLMHISHSYSQNSVITPVLHDINLKIDKGSLNAVIGPSGSGKSTMLSIMGAILQPAHGRYEYEGADIFSMSRRERVCFRNKHFGFILQDFALIQDYTVFQNEEIPLIYNNVCSRKEMRYRIEKILECLGIEKLLDKCVRNISGGEKQRVAIARALVNEPEVIFADEPTGLLDQKNAQIVMGLLKQIWKEDKTIVMVTHNDNLAAQCERIIKICDGHITEDKSIFDV